MKKKYKIHGEILLWMLVPIYSILIFFLLYFLFFPTIFEDTISYQTYEMYNKYYKDEPLVVNITENCNTGDDMEKVGCVYDYFYNNFQYKERNKTVLYSPTKAFAEGGLCRDASAIYCTVFKRMGLECKYLFKTGSHVTSAVWVNDSYYYICFLDIDIMDCVGVW